MKLLNIFNLIQSLVESFTFYGAAGGAGGGGGAMGGAMRNFNPINVRGLNQNFGGMGRPMPQVSPPQGGFPQNPMSGGMGQPPMQGMGYPAQTQGMPPMSSGGGYPAMQPQYNPRGTPDYFGTTGGPLIKQPQQGIAGIPQPQVMPAQYDPQVSYAKPSRTTVQTPYSPQQTQGMQALQGLMQNTPQY